MLAGEVLFSGPTDQAILARNALEQVPSPSVVPRNVSPVLEGGSLPGSGQASGRPVHDHRGVGCGPRKLSPHHSFPKCAPEREILKTITVNATRPIKAPTTRTRQPTSSVHVGTRQTPKL